MLDHLPKGEPPVPSTPRLTGLDVGRQALLLDLLAALASCQEPAAVWAVLATRLKWLLDFECCAVAVLNPDQQTYALRTVFDARPGVPQVEEAQVPRAAGLVGALLRRDTPFLLLDLASDQSAPPLDAWCAAGALASILTVRLQGQRETVGALLLGHGRPGGYSVLDIALAEQVAAQLGMVLIGLGQRDAQTATRAALHQSEALNRHLLENSEDAISILDLAGNLQFMNRRGQHAWEWDDAPPGHGPAWSDFWGAAAPQAAAAVAMAAHGSLGHFEGWHQPRCTTTRTWWDVLVTPMLDAQHAPVQLLAIAHDITAQRQAEEVRMHLAAIVESSDDAILSKTLDGVITSWNRGAERLYGYTAAEMVGQPLTRLIPPELADDLPQILARLRRGESLDHYETQRVTKDGTRLDIALTISPIQNGAGQISGASTIARDITARKQTDAELERRRQETALLAEIAQQLSASLDLDTVLQRLVTGTHALCRSERVFLALRDPGTDTVVGRYEIGAPERAYAGVRIAAGEGLGGQVLRTGQPWRTADYAADPRFSKEFLAQARAAGHLAVLAVPIVIAGRVEGLLYASNLASRPFSDADEAILVRLAAHAALAMQNAQLYRQAQAELAERRTAEAALARAAAELEQRVAERTAALHQEMAQRQRLEQEAQRVQHFALLGRLAAGVSHEIRNPLGAVFLHVDLLEEELHRPSPDSAAAIAEAFVELKTNLARLDALVQDYLSLVRVHAIQQAPLDFGTLVTQWAQELTPALAAQGITLHLDTLDQLGRVALHANTFRRVLVNLVDNARDAMPHGGTLTLRGRRQGATVCLDVGDTGLGIPPEQYARIFEPLHTTKPGGTGLGLYIVQEVVAAHGGQVAVRSTVGHGTLFTITLPRAET